VNEKNPVPDPGPDSGFFAAIFWAAAGFSGGFCDVIPWRTAVIPGGMFGYMVEGFRKRSQRSNPAARIVN